MGIPLHSINVIDGGTPRAESDRLNMGMQFSLATAAAGSAVTTLGAITAGTGYTSFPTITPVGGTGSGLTVVVTSLSAGGIATAVITNSGNYSVVPTGFTVTGGGGSGGAIGAPSLGVAGASVVVASGFLALPANYWVGVSANVAGDPYVSSKSASGFSVTLAPPLATTVLGAASIDILIIG